MPNPIKSKLDLSFTDYKIRSDKIIGGAILLTFSLLTILLVMEATFDLPASSFTILIPSYIVSSSLLIAYKRKVNPQTLKTLYLIFIFFLMEVHCLSNPKSLHALLHWFCFIPIAAIIVSGLRSSVFWLAIVIITITINVFYVDHLIGSSYEVTVTLVPLYIVGIIFILTTFIYTFLLYKLLGEAYNGMKQKSEALEILKSKSDAKNKKLEDYQQVLFNLSKDSALLTGDYDSLYRKICMIAVDKLGINRVSIWIFDKSASTLDRKYLYGDSGGTDEIVTITKIEFPRYFKKVLSKNYIAADDVLSDPHTEELIKRYLEPLNIFSLLDSPITLDGKTIGLICCENQHEIHRWSTEDILFVQSLSDFIALGYKSKQIRVLLQKVRTQNGDLMEKGRQIEAYNEQLSALNEELTVMNESLEVTVRNRTSILEQKNKQLREYAFINSHLLRAPLSRILGLSYIISKEKLNLTESRLLSALLLASEELDSIVRKISDLLYKGDDFGRQDIKEIIERNFKGDLKKEA